MLVAVLLLGMLLGLGGGYLIYRLSTNKQDNKPDNSASGTKINPAASNQTAPTQTAPAPQQAEPELGTEDQASAELRASEGGAVALPDGARVELPPGALPQNGPVTLRRVKLPGPEASGVLLYEIKAGGGALRAPAKLSFPLPAKFAGVQKSRVSVYRRGEGEDWKGVASRIDEATKSVRVSTDHFSFWAVSEQNAKDDENSFINELRTEAGKEAAVQLQLPYYYQGNAGWCWACSLQMLCKFYGRDLETWQIARITGSEYSEGLGAYRTIFGYAGAILNAQGFQFERTYLGWNSPLSTCKELLRQLRLGRPVWFAVPSAQHVVVVSGYSIEGLYVHDPSGLLLDFRGNSAKTDERHLCPAFIPWKDVYKKLQAPETTRDDPSALIRPNLLHTLVITDAPAHASPLTVTVMNGEIEFRIPQAPGDNNVKANRFVWDGTRRNGCDFDGLPPIIAGAPPSMPSNSDTLHSFKVRLANGGRDPATCDLQLLLDAKLFREVKKIPMPAYTSNIEVDLMQGKPHLFSIALLKPGPHIFTLELKSGTQSVDHCPIEFTMGPSRVLNPKAHRDGNKVTVKWDEPPEEKRGWNLAYFVWKDRESQPKATAIENKWEEELDPSDKKNHDYRIEAIALDASIVESRRPPGEWDKWYISGILSEKARWNEGFQKEDAGDINEKFAQHVSVGPVVKDADPATQLEASFKDAENRDWAISIGAFPTPQQARQAMKDLEKRNRETHDEFVKIINKSASDPESTTTQEDKSIWKPDRQVLCISTTTASKHSGKLQAASFYLGGGILYRDSFIIGFRLEGGKSWPMPPLNLLQEIEDQASKIIDKRFPK